MSLSVRSTFSITTLRGVSTSSTRSRTGKAAQLDLYGSRSVASKPSGSLAGQSILLPSESLWCRRRSAILADRRGHLYSAPHDLADDFATLCLRKTVIHQRARRMLRSGRIRSAAAPLQAPRADVPTAGSEAGRLPPLAISCPIPSLCVSTNTLERALVPF